MRFCQQCAKFERLTAFDSGNRSCRFRLTRRNLAKQKSLQAKAAAAQAGGGGASAAGQSPDVACGKGRGGSSSELQGSGSSEGRDTRSNDADPEQSSQRRNTNGTSAPSPSSKRTRLSSEPKSCMAAHASGSALQDESHADSRTPVPSHNTHSVGDATDFAADALAPFTSALRLDGAPRAPTSLTATAGAAAAGVAAAPAGMEVAAANTAAPQWAAGMQAQQQLLQPQQLPQQLTQPQHLTRPQAQQLVPGLLGLRLSREEPYVTLAQAPPVSEEAAAAADAAAGATGMGSGGRGSGGRSSGNRGSGGTGAAAAQQRVLNGYDAPGVGACRSPFGDTELSALVQQQQQQHQQHQQHQQQQSSARTGLGPRAAALALAGCSGSLKAARAASMDASIATALKSLSQRPGLSHSERVALESLLGLMQGCGGGGRGGSSGGLTLPPMADGVALDSQLEDIMTDVLHDDSGWCQELLASHATAPTHAASAPATWATAYLGLNGANSGIPWLPGYPTLPGGQGSYPPGGMASMRDSTTGVLQPGGAAQDAAGSQPHAQPQWLAQQQQQQQHQQQQQAQAQAQQAITMTDGSWGSADPAGSSGAHGRLHVSSVHCAVGPMVPIMHGSFGGAAAIPAATNLAAAAAVVDNANLPVAPVTYGDANHSRNNVLPRACLAISAAQHQPHGWPANGQQQAQHPQGSNASQQQQQQQLQQQQQQQQQQQLLLSARPHASTLTDAPTLNGGVGGASSGVCYAMPVSAAAAAGASGAASACGSGPAMLVDGPGTGGTVPATATDGTGAATANTGLSSGDGAWGRALEELNAVYGVDPGGGAAALAGVGQSGTIFDTDYESDYDMVRLSYKLADCDPYSLDPSTPLLLQQVAAQGCGSLAGPMPTSVRPGCVRVVAHASVRRSIAADADSQPARDAGHGDGQNGGGGFNARAPGVLAAVQQLATLNESGVVLQAGGQTICVNKEGVEVAAPAASVPRSQLGSLVRASVAAVQMGARGSIQLFGSGLAAPNVELWGRMHGVHYQLQVQHASDTYALVALPLLPACGLLTIEAEWAAAAEPANPAGAAAWAAPAAGAPAAVGAAAAGVGGAAAAAVLSDWLAVAVVPSERVAAELNALQGRLPPASLRRLLCDVGSLLDVRPLLAQPVNGLCPVVGAAGVPPSSGCSKNTWRSSSLDQDAVCGGGCGNPDGSGGGGDGPGASDDAATVASVLEGFTSTYSYTASTLASTDGPSSKTTLGGATIATTGPGTHTGGSSTLGASGLGASASVTHASSANASVSASTAAGRASAAMDLSVFMGAGTARGRSTMALQNVHRLLGCFDTSELLTNADDETVVERLLGPGPATALLSRAVSTLTLFANRCMVDSALCVVAALSELHRAFPDLLRADLAPPPPPAGGPQQRQAPGLMHAAVRCRSLALLLALARCGDVLGEHVSMGRPGPGGVTPLHLVALLGRPHAIAGLHLAVPGVRELWHTAADDTGATPADLRARSAAAAAAVAGATAGGAAAAAGGVVGGAAGAHAQGSAQQLLPLRPAGGRVSAAGGQSGGRALAGYSAAGAPPGAAAPPPIRVLNAAHVGAGAVTGTEVLLPDQLFGEELPSDLSPVSTPTRDGSPPTRDGIFRRGSPGSSHPTTALFAPLPAPAPPIQTATSSQVQSAVAEALVHLPAPWVSGGNGFACDGDGCAGGDAGGGVPAAVEREGAAPVEPETPVQVQEAAGQEQERKLGELEVLGVAAGVPIGATYIGAEQQRLSESKSHSAAAAEGLSKAKPEEDEEEVASEARAGPLPTKAAPAAEAAAAAASSGTTGAASERPANETAVALAVFALLVALLLRQLASAWSWFRVGA